MEEEERKNKREGEQRRQERKLQEWLIWERQKEHTHTEWVVMVGMTNCYYSVTSDRVSSLEICVKFHLGISGTSQVTLPKGLFVLHIFFEQHWLKIMPNLHNLFNSCYVLSSKSMRFQTAKLCKYFS